MENERPENKFVKIPKDILGVLKGYYIKLYVYLLYLSQVNNSDRIKVSQEVCSRRIGVSFAETVSRQMHKLQKQGYISIENNYSIWGTQKCNIITILHKPTDKDYFLLPSEHLFHPTLSSGAFEVMLTLYMFSFDDPYSYPSFADIRNTARVSYGTIASGYKQLEYYGIIKTERYNKTNGSKGQNRYILIKKVERKIGKNNTARFLAWLSDKKAIGSAIWNSIQNFLLGRITIEQLLSINDGSSSDKSNDVPPSHTIFEEQAETLHTEYDSNIWGKIRRKVHTFIGKVTAKTAALYAKFKRVLLQSQRYLE